MDAHCCPYVGGWCVLAKLEYLTCAMCLCLAPPVVQLSATLEMIGLSFPGPRPSISSIDFWTSVDRRKWMVVRAGPLDGWEDPLSRAIGIEIAPVSSLSVSPLPQTFNFWSLFLLSIFWT